MPEKNRAKTGGRFRPGQSGNPAGRPRGARNRASVIVSQMLEGDIEPMVQKLIDAAKGGDVLALRLVIERVLPRARSSPVAFDLPQIVGANDIAKGTAAVLQAAAAGEISLGEAREFMALLEAHRKALETNDLAVRLQLIESSLSDDGEERMEVIR